MIHYSVEIHESVAKAMSNALDKVAWHPYHTMKSMDIQISPSLIMRIRDTGEMCMGSMLELSFFDGVITDDKGADNE